MKKIKTTCAIVGAAIIMYAGSAFGLQQKYDVPEYSKEGAKEKIKYYAFTKSGLIFIDNPSQVKDLPIFIEKLYGIDRNKDGKIDLIHTDIELPEMKYNNPFTGETIVKPAYKITQLIIDDDFDGDLDRMLFDTHGKDKKTGADGIYDKEDKSPSIEDMFNN